MSKHDDRVSLKDMLSHAREAVELPGNASRQELGSNRVMQLALTRLLAEGSESCMILTGKMNVRDAVIQVLQEIGKSLHAKGITKRILAILNEQMAVVERARKAAGEELNTINALPAALLRRAFSGNFRREVDHGQETT